MSPYVFMRQVEFSLTGQIPVVLSAYLFIAENLILSG
mgnify:CR=1 FL=1